MSDWSEIDFSGWVESKLWVRSVTGGGVICRLYNVLEVAGHSQLWLERPLRNSPVSRGGETGFST